MIEFDKSIGDIDGKHRIFFNEEEHVYTDELGNKLNSVTTIIGNYTNKFDTDKMAKICAKIGRNPSHPKYHKYRNKTEKQLKYEWNKTTEEALDKGNMKHNYLEDAIKSCNNYTRVKDKFINDRLFTIPDIIKNPDVGRIDINKLNEYGIADKYPDIYKTLVTFINVGWKIYAEIGVYSVDLLVSGLVDLLLIKGKSFLIFDWKTNKAPIAFKSGYYAKDDYGNLTDNFIYKNESLKYPIDNLADSVGNKYSLQLSTYAYLIEQFGLKYAGTYLFHIRTLEDDTDVVERLRMNYLRDDVINMLSHYYSNLNIKNQNLLFNESTNN